MWIYEGKEIRSLQDVKDILGYIPYGVCYNITCSNGKEYIGQKKFFSERTKKVSNKRLKEKGKSYFRRKKVTKGKHKGEWYYYEVQRTETNWLKYTGSSDKLNKDIKDNGITFTKYILAFCDDQTELNYLEHKNIMCTSAMEDEKFYNDSTQIRVFKKNIINRVNKN